MGEPIIEILQHLVVMRCCLYLDILQNEVKRFQSTMGKLCPSPVCAVLGRTVVTSRRSLKITHRLQNVCIHTSLIFI